MTLTNLGRRWLSNWHVLGRAALSISCSYSCPTNVVVQCFQYSWDPTLNPLWSTEMASEDGNNTKLFVIDPVFPTFHFLQANFVDKRWQFLRIIQFEIFEVPNS